MALEPVVAVVVSVSVTAVGAPDAARFTVPVKLLRAMVSTVDVVLPGATLSVAGEALSATLDEPAPAVTVSAIVTVPGVAWKPAPCSTTL